MTTDLPNGIPVPFRGTIHPWAEGYPPIGEVSGEITRRVEYFEPSGPGIKSSITSLSGTMHPLSFQPPIGIIGGMCRLDTDLGFTIGVLITEVGLDTPLGDARMKFVSSGAPLQNLRNQEPTGPMKGSTGPAQWRRDGG